MVELQEILKQLGISYKLKHRLLSHQQRVIHAIQNCRTAALGGHMDKCNECDFTRISYNSCRNRHCPKCQTINKERWIEARKDDLLNVRYFHVVFTIPDLINSVAYQNQKVIYDILFKAAPKP